MQGEIELKSAIYQVLSAALAPIKVFEHYTTPPAAKPYVVIAECTGEPWDTKTGGGREVTIRLEMASEYSGWRELSGMGATIYQALHNQHVYVERYRIVVIQEQSSDTQRENDGRTRTARIVYRVLLKPNEV